MGAKAKPMPKGGGKPMPPWLQPKAPAKGGKKK